MNETMTTIMNRKSVRAYTCLLYTSAIFTNGPGNDIMKQTDETYGPQASGICGEKERTGLQLQAG